MTRRAGVSRLLHELDVLRVPGLIVHFPGAYTLLFSALVGGVMLSVKGVRELLAEVAARDGLDVRTVPVAAGLHLKSAVTLVDERTVVVHAGALDESAFTAAGLTVLRVTEPAGGNVLALGEVVLVSADAPATAALLTARGHTVITVELSEFHRGDGALTCLSLRLPPPGGWCA